MKFCARMFAVNLMYLEQIFVLEFVIEFCGGPECSVLNDPERVVLVSGPDVEGKGRSVGRLVRICHGESEQNVSERFVLLKESKK